MLFRQVFRFLLEITFQLFRPAQPHWSTFASAMLTTQCAARWSVPAQRTAAYRLQIVWQPLPHVVGAEKRRQHLDRVAHELFHHIVWRAALLLSQILNGLQQEL
jgi:hypothetical protein